jgi:hypothetical protein
LRSNDWLADGMDGRSPATVAKYRHVLAPVLADLGNRVLTDLTAREVKAALSRYATNHATETASIARLGLERANRRAEANDLVSRNVAALVETPRGQSWQAKQGADRHPGRRDAAGVAGGRCGSGVPWLPAAAADADARLYRAVPAGRDPH